MFYSILLTSFWKYSCLCFDYTSMFVWLQLFLCFSRIAKKFAPKRSGASFTPTSCRPSLTSRVSSFTPWRRICRRMTRINPDPEIPVRILTRKGKCWSSDLNRFWQDSFLTIEEFSPSKSSAQEPSSKLSFTKARSF